MATFFIYSAVYLLLSIFLTAITNAQVRDVCLWGHYSTYSREVNGLYRIGGESVNNRPYYKLDHTGQGCEYPYLWMYYISNIDLGNPGWYIGFSSGSEFGFGEGGAVTGTVAYCESGTASTPAACSGWYFASPPWSDNWVIDGNVTVTAGRCPGFDCAGITVTDTGTNNAGCTSNDGATVLPYAQIGANEYYLNKAGFGQRVWYFNIPTFQWFCIDIDAFPVNERCDNWTRPWNYDRDGLLQSANPQPWQDLSVGESITITNVYGYGGCNVVGGCSTTFTCSGTSTTSTYSPTSPNPTKPAIPTPRPTFRPITEAPTAAPTDVPTEPTTNSGPSPTAPTAAQPTAPTVATGKGNGGGGNGGIIGEGWAGLDWLWWIIILVIACCLCCLCLLLCGKLCQKKRAERRNQVEMFGDQGAGGGGGGSYQPDPTYTVD